MEKQFVSPFSGERPERKENISAPSIRLEFFRHGKTEPQTEGKQEHQRRLTDEGRIMATESGKNRNSNPEIGLIYGSPRERSQETAYRQLFSNNSEITEDKSLEDIEELIKNKLPVGQKKIIDERLNYNWSGSQKFNEISTEHLNAKNALKFLVEESDNLALESGDKISTSYSRCAGNTAEIIQKYLKILPNWERIAQADSQKIEGEKKDYAKNNNELQRFLGSHGATVENFLLKLIDKTEGRKATLEFIKNLPDQNNFQFNDGYSVRLFLESNQPKIEIKYHDKIWNIAPEMLNEFIGDKDKLDKKIADKQ